MGMASGHLADQLFEEVGHREFAPLARNLGVEADLEEKIPQFLADALGLASVEGVEHLVGFLDQERTERVAGLFSVPGAPALATQAGHYRQQLKETLASVRARHRERHRGRSGGSDTRPPQGAVSIA